MDGYSRLVALLKVLLPLAALALLSTLFLLSRGVDPDATIPFAKTEIQDRLRERQITAPFFSGVTEKGEEILVTATAARPGIFSGNASADNLSGRITLVGGTLVFLSALKGTIEADKNRVSFQGTVDMETSQGFQMTSETLHSALDIVAIESPGLVKGTSPIGTFTAGMMLLTQGSETKDAVLQFKNGVKLIYDPKQIER